MQTWFVWTWSPATTFGAVRATTIFKERNNSQFWHLLGQWVQCVRKWYQHVTYCLMSRISFDFIIRISWTRCGSPERWLEQHQATLLSAFALIGWTRSGSSDQTYPIYCLIYYCPIYRLIKRIQYMANCIALHYRVYFNLITMLMLIMRIGCNNRNKGEI